MRRIKKRSRLARVARVLVGVQQIRRYRAPTRESNEVFIDVIADESDRTMPTPAVPYGSRPPRTPEDT